MDRAFINKLADEVSEFEGLQDHWPQDWSIDDVDARIEEHQTVLDEAEQRGLNRIGAGGYRVVFEVLPNNEVGLPTDRVLKISKSDGTGQNREAVGVFEELEEDARTYVASIHKWSNDHRWVLQEKASNAKRGDVQRVIDGLAEHGYACSDIRRDNCGRTGDQPVLIDLALLR